MRYKESFNDFINSQNWIFAKTMAGIPHWYCLKSKCDLINRCVIPAGERKPENFPNIIR